MIFGFSFLNAFIAGRGVEGSTENVHENVTFLFMITSQKTNKHMKQTNNAEEVPKKRTFKCMKALMPRDYVWMLQWYFREVGYKHWQLSFVRAQQLEQGLFCG